MWHHWGNASNISCPNKDRQPPIINLGSLCYIGLREHLLSILGPIWNQVVHLLTWASSLYGGWIPLVINWLSASMPTLGWIKSPGLYWGKVVSFNLVGLLIGLSEHLPECIRSKVCNFKSVWVFNMHPWTWSIKKGSWITGPELLIILAFIVAWWASTFSI